MRMGHFACMYGPISCSCSTQEGQKGVWTLLELEFQEMFASHQVDVGN